MKGEVLFLLVAVAIALSVVAGVQLVKHGHRIKRTVVNYLINLLQAYQRNPGDASKKAAGNKPSYLADEQQSEEELERLQKIIEERKQLARDMDISYHLWSFYAIHFRNAHESAGRHGQDGEWYDFKILKTSTNNDLNEFEFEMNGNRYRFVDDEETQSWALNVKVFSLFLYDDSDRCLIEIPIKVQVDRTGRRYSISPGGPKAFLPGDWTKEFINTKLKHQRMRNLEIREQKHQERLNEIQELKDRFGIWD
jgi:hypothetical protein